MNLDIVIIWLFLFAAAMFIASVAVLIYSCSLLLHVQMKLRQWRPLRVAEHDGDGRRRQERV